MQNLNSIQQSQPTIFKEILKLTLFILMYPITMLFFPPIVRSIGLKSGYWIAFAIYWILIVSFSVYYFRFKGIAKLYKMKTTRQEIWISIAFIPVVLTFFIAFLPSVSMLTPSFLILAIVVGCINGFCEELFWRGLTLHTAFKKKWVVIAVSLVGFGLWHFTLVLPGEITYQGGISALVGGAVFMGILWQLTATKTNNILYTTIAHMAVNTFAMSAMILENWQL